MSKNETNRKGLLVYATFLLFIFILFYCSSLRGELERQPFQKRRANVVPKSNVNGFKESPSRRVSLELIINIYILLRFDVGRQDGDVREVSSFSPQQFTFSSEY